MPRLSGTTVLITGASRGLGRALALAAAREGATLALCARGSEDLEAVATACRQHGGDVLAVTADVAEPRDVERLASTALARLGVIDILVNNASELGPVPLPHLTDAPPSALEPVLRTNVLGPLRLTQAVLGGMLLRGRGLVVNISSDAAVNGYPGWGLYSASKAALDALTRSWAAELEGTGVRVISVDPGDMDTAMHRAAIPDADPSELARPGDVAERLIGLLAGVVPEADRVEAASLP
ncbi:MAG TPA: SDR family NAD(P)-dependent oxidoreductase [Candidatus Acidoferrales bacterium]|jgi:NAD(P)-dependent dehydrogenase (short-subunit alcohol dehydrogenase family)|nr:SDR family NAD(P)-dependent oxidoreductase [Candidatus Acidoferrales bacterium]